MTREVHANLVLFLCELHPNTREESFYQEILLAQSTFVDFLGTFVTHQLICKMIACHALVPFLCSVFLLIHVMVSLHTGPHFLCVRLKNA